MVIERIKGYADLGVRHFELKFIAHSLDDQLEMMQLVAEQVVPAFSPSSSSQ